MAEVDTKLDRATWVFVEFFFAESFIIFLLGLAFGRSY